MSLQLSHACPNVVAVRDKPLQIENRERGEQMFVDKETKRLAETLAEKLQGMTGNEDLHPSQVQWLFDVSELLGQLS
jgi:hypothetical protein